MQMCVECPHLGHLYICIGSYFISHVNWVSRWSQGCASSLALLAAMTVKTTWWDPNKSISPKGSPSGVWSRHATQHARTYKYNRPVSIVLLTVVLLLKDHHHPPAIIFLILLSLTFPFLDLHCLD